jgi:hypothetical protein
MTRSSRHWPAAALLAILLAAVAGRASAADSPLAGNWKFKLVNGGSDGTAALIQIETKDGKPAAKILGGPGLPPGAALEDVRVDGNTINLNLKINGNANSLTASAPKGEEKPKTLRGTLQVGTRLLFIELEQTDAKEVGPADARKQTPGGEALLKALQTRDAKEREQGLKDVLEKFGDTTAGYGAAEMLLPIQVKAGAKDDDLRALADRMLKVAKNYGPVAEKKTVLSVAQALARAEKPSPLAVEYARQAEKGLSKDDPATASVPVLKTLVAALTKSGKADDAKQYAATLAKLEAQLDEEFEKGAIPFKPTVFAGRKGKSSRVAVVELFTGAQCPPCVSADIAFDAAAQTYKPADVALLEYHLHIPGPDPLTNADTEARQKYYGRDIQGTPTTFVNGKVTEGLGGYKQHGEERYKTLTKIIDEALEAEEQANLKLTAERKGDKVEAEATVADLKKTGDKVKLRFVLIEDVARYAGSNGQRLHHHVVRAFPGGIDGFPMKDAKGTQKVTVALGDVKKSLTDYLASAEKKRPFLDDDRPMDLKHLKLIALIQDDESKEILQAAQIDLPEEK